MYGQGILTGLKITFKYLFRPPVTQNYPTVKPILPARVRNSLSLDPEKCIACGLCAAACPNKVITLTSSKDANNKKVLESYTMNVGYCLFCGLCTEACPTGALKVSHDYENSVEAAEELIWDMMKRAKQR